MRKSPYNPSLEHVEAEARPPIILALDVGRKRIGLAVSDPLGITAQGLPTLHRTRIREDLDFLQRIAAERGVSLLLIGKPLHLSGDSSAQSQYTEEFAARLGKALSLPVTFWDERFTSREAERRLRDTGTSTARESGNVDRLAAILLLESYLEFSSGAGAGSLV